MDILVRTLVYILCGWIRPAEVMMSPNKLMVVVRGLPPNKGAHRRRRGREESARRARHWQEIQWELMEDSLTIIGPHYMEIKEPTTTLTDW